MRNLTCSIAVLASIFSSHLVAAETRLPSFLPGYYAPIFGERENSLMFVRHGETNGVNQFLYCTADRGMFLSVENIDGDRPKCETVFNNILGYLNHQITSSNRGEFVEITAKEVHAEIIQSNATQSSFVFVLPNSVNIWTYSLVATNQEGRVPEFGKLRDLADRQRYERALQSGNVAMGQWGKSIHDYAKRLLNAGKTDEALAVLKNLLSTSPYDYQAHLEFMENTPDSETATNSARTVLRNAENADQITKAAKFLGAPPKTIEDFAPLETNETGLQLILVPFTPCNAWLLEDAAKVYQTITDVPVKIRRLPEEWFWGSPERIARQRDLQGMLARLKRQNMDFPSWTKDRYIETLSDAVKSEDALSKYWVRDFVEKIKNEPGQYLADSRLLRFCDTLKKYRSKDVRTMYVAISEANIYSGDNNYVFSMGTTTNSESPASIMSYYMMLGKTLGETYESRQRLVERIAKELVPASLKQLGIPRSTDPTCPYSYSGGVDRLDQKTLTLSEEVKQALQKLK